MAGSTHFPAAVGWLVGAGLLCCLGGAGAYPFPDFGIPGPVANSAKVQSIAVSIGNDFDNVDEYGITLTSSYGALATVRDTLYSISEEVAQAGEAIGTAFGTLATNAGPSIDTVFNAATNAITSMEALLSTGFNDEFDTLDGIIATYVTSEFRDSFSELGTMLVSLRQAVGRLKPAVEQAKAASKNSATIAGTLISKYVTPKMMQDVLDGLTRLRSGISVITYTVTDTLSMLEVADEFIVDITGNAETETASVEAEYEFFAEQTTAGSTASSANLATALREGYTAETDAIALIQPELDASTDYSDNFLAQLSTVAGLFDTAALSTFELDITDRFTSYLDRIAALDDDAVDFFGGTACAPIYSLVHVLIDNGPFAVFCFDKYASLAYNLFPNFVLMVSECYSTELLRLDDLYLAVQPLVQLILYDIEDLADSLATCVSYPDDMLCFSLIAPLYQTLLAVTTTKRDYIHGLLTHETDASVQRYSACYHARKFILRQVIAELDENVLQCETDGPLAV